MQSATNAFNFQVREKEIVLRYRTKMLIKVYQRLKFQTMKSRKEQLVSSIIREKHEWLTVLEVLGQWRKRLGDRMEKQVLYGQVALDRDIRIKRRIVWTLKANVEEKKEKKIQEIIASRQDSRRSSARHELPPVPASDRSLNSKRKLALASDRSADSKQLF